jgi:hypothetical protein
LIIALSFYIPLSQLVYWINDILPELPSWADHWNAVSKMVVPVALPVLVLPDWQ